RTFGALLTSNARATDIICRFGGEEFLLVLPGMTKEGARQRAEYLRHAMGATIVSHGNCRITVTASLGIAAFPADGRTGDELIAAADGALYAAKAQGRNRVSL
ncbi:MAG TPA: GGDEF domain-containing protein, partial [Polyangia bacterium]